MGKRIGLLVGIAAVLAVIGVPWRGLTDSAPEFAALSRATRLGGFVDRALAPVGGQFTASGASLPGAARLLNRFQPRGADAIDLALGRLAIDEPTLSHLSRTGASLWLGEDDVPPPSGRGTASFPLRAPPGMGERGLDLLRVSAENRSHFPEDFAAALADLVGAVERAAVLSRMALGAAAERRGEARERLREAVDRMSVASIDVTDGSDKGLGKTDEELTRLIGDIDVRGLSEALIVLSDAVQRARPVLERAVGAPFVRALRPLPDGEGVPRNLVLVSETEAGLLLIGGEGTTVLPVQGAAIAIDLGGDDRWHDGVSLGQLEDLPEPFARVAIDLAGRDRYTSVASGLGAATLGVSALLDVAGDDRYEADEIAFGAALGGAALLVDDDGDDRYRCDRAGLGFGLLGLGMLFDGGSDDEYKLGALGLGAGATGGAGLLIDHQGFDLYVAAGSSAETTDTDSAEAPAGKSARAGGVAFSAAPGLGAGFGLLLDRRGDDVYRAASASFGFVDGAGIGLAVDLAGDDRYASGDLGLGAASGGVGGVAVFRDLSGRNDYLSRTRSQGYAFGPGIGLFIDDAGRDRCYAVRPAQGAGAGGGLGLFANVR